jgi:hypothetical protein
MRSTRGVTRASKVIAKLPPKPLMTPEARVTAPLRSNSPTHRRPNALASVRNAQWGARNTNTRLKDSGISSYYRSREGLGQ